MRQPYGYSKAVIERPGGAGDGAFEESI